MRSSDRSFRKPARETLPPNRQSGFEYQHQPSTASQSMIDHFAFRDDLAVGSAVHAGLVALFLARILLGR